MLPLPTSAVGATGSARVSAGAGRALLAAALGAAQAKEPCMKKAGGYPETGDGTPEVEVDEKTAAGWELLRSALGWRNPRGGGGKAGKQAPGPEEEEPAQSCRGFDFADSMEAGLARETSTDFTTPLRRSGRLWRFRVLRSQDRAEARLVAEGGEFLMYARVCIEARRVAFFLYDPLRPEEQALFNPRAPAFSMTYNASHSEWRLVQERCDRCALAPEHLSCSRCGKQQLAFIRHHRVQVGDGMSNVMEAIIPGLYSDGRALVWCPMLGRGQLGSSHGDGPETQVLLTKLPAWNEQVQSLVLDFKGRNIVASAKNFQLGLCQKPEHVICQYGKLSDSSFSLDLKFPLSMIQAFGLAMSTSFWV